MNIMQAGPIEKKKSRWARKPEASKVETPTWFNLRRYGGLRELGALQWFDLIALRCYLLGELEAPEDLGARVDLRRAIDEICIDPLNDRQLDRSFPDEMYWYWYCAHSFHWLEPSGVKLLTHSDLNGVAEWEEKRRDTQSPTPIVDLNSPICCNNALGETVQLMSVDLNSPDAVLVEQFKKNLSELRKVIQQPCAVESVSPSFEAWIDHGVLPFLDLKLWGNAHNKWISNPRLARAIYSDQLRGEGSIRNTTEAHADALMDTRSPTFNGLRIDARRERSYTNLAFINIQDT
jgi:Family of unknown function (DUF6387)